MGIPRPSKLPETTESWARRRSGQRSRTGPGADGSRRCPRPCALPVDPMGHQRAPVAADAETPGGERPASQPRAHATSGAAVIESAADSAKERTEGGRAVSVQSTCLALPFPSTCLLLKASLAGGGNEDLPWVYLDDREWNSNCKDSSRTWTWHVHLLGFNFRRELGRSRLSSSPSSYYIQYYRLSP
jgi:hypothetical protein